MRKRKVETRIHWAQTTHLTSFGPFVSFFFFIHVFFSYLLTIYYVCSTEYAKGRWRRGWRALTTRFASFGAPRWAQNTTINEEQGLETCLEPLQVCFFTFFNWFLKLLLTILNLQVYYDLDTYHHQNHLDMLPHGKAARHHQPKNSPNNGSYCRSGARDASQAPR